MTRLTRPGWAEDFIVEEMCRESWSAASAHLRERACGWWASQLGETA